MTGRDKSGAYQNQPRRDCMYEARVQNSYIEKRKLPEPSVCPDCGAIFDKGRWQWGSAKENAYKHNCPACRRIRERVPAALLTLGGDYFLVHRDEIMRLVHNKEEKEIKDHPLERIMGIEQLDETNQTVISFTGIHLARSTGDALSHAHKGTLEYKYTDKDGVLIAHWAR